MCTFQRFHCSHQEELGSFPIHVLSPTSSSLLVNSMCIQTASLHVDFTMPSCTVILLTSDFTMSPIDHHLDTNDQEFSSHSLHGYLTGSATTSGTFHSNTPGQGELQVPQNKWVSSTMLTISNNIYRRVPASSRDKHL